jgi:hypothetical protein
LRGAHLHPDLRIIFTVAECPYRIVARRSAGVRWLADLRGKRLGTQVGSSAEYVLDRMLCSGGASANDICSALHMAKTAAPLTQLPHALKSGAPGAFTVWEPQLQKAVGMLGDDAIVFCDASMYSEQFCLCSSQAKRSAAAENRCLCARAGRRHRSPAVRSARCTVAGGGNRWPGNEYRHRRVAAMRKAPAKLVDDSVLCEARAG